MNKDVHECMNGGIMFIAQQQQAAAVHSQMSVCAVE